MDDDIKYIRDKLDDVETAQSTMNETLAVNTTLLGEHIRRTNDLEDRVDPIEDHVKGAQTLMSATKWGLGVLVSLAGLAFTISRFI